ncbi:CRISPR/Cas system CSM-associated protein Csm3 (group 7 of RAMP superfamily) [Actinoalloteichus hoggarensis]|uniref:RAMP superfamily protein n=1 Tax=Actinoalloteichus hoggarensis TaxID=1470176 RepID=A0A221W866_9PSEU|nr:RAMP superfamily CRISPR-associated protein [Actinoalloteichus hoggarensis]ASO21527.1 RAMP superfamily protein [Actinoalloteichus hoggarensis]MBB5922117.1 CRISPR/Cas system CSM-associated protein Csm3 (group 7 of RAMP superfamily) [Actinoalloteichus hoggarensis]
MTVRLLVSVTLRLTAPGGVAAPELLAQDDDGLLFGTALPLARTPRGMPWIPATSVAGSLRAHLADRAEAFLGGEPGDEVFPSTLWLLGTRVDHQGITERTRTAIDRWRGAAAAGPLRRSEHLPAGTRITVYLRLDDVTLADELLGALRTWRPRIGGGRTIGHGTCVLEQIRGGRLDLDTPEGRRIWLTRGGPGLFDDDLTDHVETPPVPNTHPPVLHLSWSIVDGLHIGNGEIDHRGNGQNDVALILRTHDGTPEIPGSAWKGLLRSRCEFILRSLGVVCCSPAVDLDATTPGCGDCLICRAFGTASSAGPSRRGRLDFRSSPVADAEIVEQRHVALDRVFGGARAGALYSRQVVRSGTLDLVVDALDTLPPGATALVTLACLDIHDGLLGVGAATTRGLGTLRLRSTPEAVGTLRTEALHALTAALTGADAELGESRTT